MRSRPRPAVRPSERRRVTLVTAAWGGQDEGTFALRSTAGALATEAQVTVVHVVPTPPEPEVVRDGSFEVRRVLGGVPEPLTQGAVLAAVGGAGPGRPLPELVGRGLLELEGGWSEAVLPAVEATAPDVVVLGGIGQAWPPATLAELASRAGRLVVVPLAGDDPKLELAGYRDVLGAADVVVLLTAAERRRVEAALGGVRGVAGGPALVDLVLPLRASPAVRRQRLIGLAGFDGYVLVLRGFPPGAPERHEVPDYAWMRALSPGIDVADVSEGGWHVLRGERRGIVPVGHSRVNLWRLMAHALVTVDLRPGGLLGREVIESLSLGVPVIVPVGHPAEEAVAESGGGLLLEQQADLPELVASLVAGGQRAVLSERAEAWAEAHRSDQDTFVQAVVRGLLG